MTITSKFYTGAVNNIQWAEGLRAASYRYVVSDDAGTGTGFKVAINAGITRGFTIAAGVASGGGITDINDATLTGAPYAVPFNAADRWWLIGLRRVWGATKATSVDWISAGTTKVMPVRPMVPGIEDFQPLALAFVPAGGGAITILADLRALGGNSGHLTIFDPLAKDYLNQVGTRLLEVRSTANGGTLIHDRTVNSAGAVVWESRPRGGAYACRLTRTTAQSISDSVATTVSWTSTVYDYGDMHDPAVNSGNRIFFPVAGVYHIGAAAQFASAVYERSEILIRLNGTTTIAFRRWQGNAFTVSQLIGVETSYEFAAGDYIEVRVEQKSGGSRNLDSIANSPTAANYSPVFYATLIRPS